MSIEPSAIPVQLLLQDECERLSFTGKLRRDLLRSKLSPVVCWCEKWLDATQSTEPPASTGIDDSQQGFPTKHQVA